jgi:hypothetical protein
MMTLLEEVCIDPRVIPIRQQKDLIKDGHRYEMERFQGKIIMLSSDAVF